MELLRNNEQPLAFINQCDATPGRGDVSSQIEAVGHIGRDASQNYLNVTIERPTSEDTGIYTCILHYMDGAGQLKMQTSSGNLLVEKLDMNSLETVLKEIEKTISTMKKNDDLQQQEITKLQKKNEDLQQKVDYQNAFTVTTQNTSIRTRAGDVLILPDVILQIGSGYDLKNGIFTAPRDGLYVFHLSVDSVNPQPTCPTGWVLNGRSCFRLFEKKMNWANARDFCYRQKSHLVTIPDESTNRFLAQQFNPRDMKSIWIGFNDIEKEGEFKWLTGSDAVTFSNWDQNQPDDHENRQDCAIIWQFKSGRWDDAGCTALLEFICQKDEDAGCHMEIQVNGRGVAKLNFYEQMSISSVVSLTTGDKVFTKMLDGGCNVNTDMYTTFGGYLVKSD